ncbi:MAG: ABC transporter ATP-binding protein [Acidobacteriota bacterium]
MLEVKDLSKKYSTPAGPLSILEGVSLSIDQGSAIAIMGPSGSGKSTLLYILGALESPTAGRVTLDGVDPHLLSEKDLAAFRNRKIGFVFQDHCLLPQCSVLENVLAPTLVSTNDRGITDKARSLLDAVGLGSRLDHRPAELSGGEKQRVAIARSLINDPVLLLCDEPTGNLDHRSAENVADLLVDLQGKKNTTLVVVTHSTDLASRFPIRYEMLDQHLKLSK